MAWKNFVGPNAITSRRRVVASALMYGLSLTVRFTSPTGEEAENSAHAAQGKNLMSSIVINDGAQIFKSWPNPVHSIVFQRSSSTRSSRSCRAVCERPMPLMLDCSPP